MMPASRSMSNCALPARPAQDHLITPMHASIEKCQLPAACSRHAHVSCPCSARAPAPKTKPKCLPRLPPGNRKARHRRARRQPPLPRVQCRVRFGRMNDAMQSVAKRTPLRKANARKMRRKWNAGRSAQMMASLPTTHLPAEEERCVRTARTRVRL